jgi:hypothetical protein
MITKFFVGETTHSDNDLRLNDRVKGSLPFLIFADGIIDKLTVLTETLSNDDNTFDIYHKDGKDVTETNMLNINSLVAGMYSLYFINDKDGGYLSSMSIAQTVNGSLFKNKVINQASKIFPTNFTVNDTTNETLLFSLKEGTYKLPEPSINFGSNVIIKTLRLSGIKTFSLPYRTKVDTNDGSLYIEDSLLPVLEIDTSLFTDWDPKTLPFYTLVQNSNGTFVNKFVGPADVDKFYIPLQ